MTLDVLKTMPENLVDLTVTSPPYNKKTKLKKNNKPSKNTIWQPIVYDTIGDNMPEQEYQKNQIDVMNEIHRVTKPGGSLFYNHKVRTLKGIVTHPMEWVTKTKWHLRQEIIWNRKSTFNFGGYRFYQLDERIYWLYKPVTPAKKVGARMISRHAKCSSIWEFVPDMKNDHPAPFPLDLPLRTILSILDVNDGVVLDPYMGSGTTAVACKLLNKDYIGIDISENYINKANNRINNFESERYKLKKELENHVVIKSYKERQQELFDKKLKYYLPKQEKKQKKQKVWEKDKEQIKCKIITKWPL